MRGRRHVAAGLALLVACGACGLGAESSDDLPATLLEETRGGLACGGADRFWCDALDRFEAGDVPAPTVDAYSLIGVGRLPHGQEEVRYFLSRPGERMLVGEITPDDPDEARQLEEAVATLRAGGTLPETAPVVQFVRGLATDSAFPPHATRVEGRSRYADAGQYELWVRQNGNEIITMVRDRLGTTIAVHRR